MKEYKTLKIEEREEGISIITLNRPERLNAINFEMSLYYNFSMYELLKVVNQRKD